LKKVQSYELSRNLENTEKPTFFVIAISPLAWWQFKKRHNKNFSCDTCYNDIVAVLGLFFYHSEVL